jgi:uncharacterized membrane protein
MALGQILEGSPLGTLYLWNKIVFNVSWPLPPNNETLFYDYNKMWSAGPLGTSTNSAHSSRKDIHVTHCASMLKGLFAVSGVKYFHL